MPKRFPLSAVEAKGVRIVVNPLARKDLGYSPAHLSVISRSALAEANSEITAWPGYAPTPLLSLPGLAREIGVGRIWLKDEGARFGLGSFKALGGAYAVLRVLQREIVKRRGGAPPSSAELRAGKHRDIVQGITVTTATDGNHGRSVAWGAQIFGCQSVIYIHAHVSDGRERAIAAYGARMVRITGNYDDSVRQAASDARRNGWSVVSDTSWPGYRDIPRDVMQGYALMADEAMAVLPEAELPTHIFVQGGVGGLAAAICGYFWERYGQMRPYFVVVEPERAACLFASARAGQPTAVTIEQETVMAGLSCGEISPLAWEILATGANMFVTIPDDAAVSAMRRLAHPEAADRPVVAGESGVAGLAGLLCIRARPALAKLASLDAGARILCINSEGATDPELYSRIVGETAEAVRARAA
jgi:diaminopropionate ammonia-lyase